MEWINETNIKDFSSYVGFIYRINYTDGTVYFGKKNFTIQRTLPPLKGYKRKRKILKESNWKKYEGSSDWGKYKVVQSKTILKVFKTKGGLTYGEVELLVRERVLFRLDCLNFNISGRFYKRNIETKEVIWKKYSDTRMENCTGFRQIRK